MTDLRGQRLSRRWRPKKLTRVGQRRLLLLHVPKTGGSTLKLMIKDHVPDEDVFLSTGKQEWIDSSVADLQAVKVFLGHNFTAPLAMMPEDDWVTLLPVREPVSWWQSWYKYQRREIAKAGREDPILEQTMDEWLRACDDEALSNPQSSWLLTRHVLTWDHPLTRPGRLTDTAVAAKPDPDGVADALESLVERVSVVGITDDLFTMYQRTCELMGWEPKHQEALHDNVSRAREPGLLDLSDEQRERLLALNGFDSHLYALARARAGSGPAVPPRSPRATARSGSSGTTEAETSPGTGGTASPGTGGTASPGTGGTASPGTGGKASTGGRGTPSSGPSTRRLARRVARRGLRELRSLRQRLGS